MAASKGRSKSKSKSRSRPTARTSSRAPLAILILLPIVVGLGLLYATAEAYLQRSSQQARQSAPAVAQEAKPEAKPPEIKTELPAGIKIDSIGVDAVIESVGLTEDGMMDDPDASEVVGWYDQSARLGGTKYAMLLAGHYGTRDNAAVFQRLSEVSQGDIIEVSGDGDMILQYQIVETELLNTEDVDMRRALYPYRDGVQSLTIITCEGEFLPDEVTYDKRLIVYAELVQ